MTQRNDIPPTDASFLFKETLKMRRRGMSPGNRRRTQNPRINIRTIFPNVHERPYTKYLFDLMDVYSDIALPVIRANIQRWTEEQRVDSIRTDDFNTEFQQLLDELRQTQDDMFLPDGDGVKTERRFFNNKAIIAVLTGVGFAVSRFNQRQSNKTFKRILGGQSFIPSEPWLNSVVEAWASNNFTLIKSLSDEYIKKTNTIVSEGVLNGTTWDEIMRDTRKMDRNMTRSRARLISRDQVGKLNGRLTKRRQQEVGISMYRWITAQDERVRPTHQRLNNKICRWDDNSLYADSVEDARAGRWKSRSAAGMFVGIPGQDIQCIPGFLNVSFNSGIVRCFRRWFTGKLTCFITSSNEFVCMTGNHPVLTLRGWVGAKELKLSDYIIKVVEKDISFGKPNKDNRKVSAQEVFDSFNLSGVTNRIRGITSQFHNDGIIDQEVDIVTSNGKLRIKRNSIFTKFFRKFRFTISNMILIRIFITRLGCFIKLFFTSLFSSLGKIGILSKLFPFFRSSLRHPKSISFRLTSNGDIVLDKSSSNTVPIEFVFFRTHFHRKTISIIKNQLINVNRFSVCRVFSVFHINYSGYVYNFETKSNIYFINNLSSHNCRCDSIAIFDEVIEEIDNELVEENQVLVGG